MRSYYTLGRETYEDISERVYGFKGNGALIRQCNPHLIDIIPTDLVQPELQELPPNLLVRYPEPVSVTGVDVFATDEIEVYILGERVRGWKRVQWTAKVDGIRDVELDTVFDPDDPTHRRLFKPLQFQPIQVWTKEDGRIFTGTVINVEPLSTDKQALVRIQAYSRPGVLADCTAPASLTPLEWHGATMDAIFGRIGKVFEISTLFPNGVGPRDDLKDRRVLYPGNNVWPFLTKIAKDKKFLIKDDAMGDLVVHKPDASGPLLLALTENSPPLKSVALVTNAQQYFSDVVGLQPTIVEGILGGKAVPIAVSRLHDLKIMRPHSFKTFSILDKDIQLKVEAKIARMYAEVVKFNIELNTWQQPSGLIWQPGDIVSLLAPHSMIYTPTNVIFDTVRLTATPTSRKAEMQCVLPDSYTGREPRNLPWD